MPSLDALITQWSDQLCATRPEPAPNLDELADHVRSSAQDRIDAGGAVGEAFASALGSFGAPADLGAEFDRNSTVRKGKERMAVGTYLLIAGIFTGAVLLVDRRFDLGGQALNWLLVVWVLTTGLQTGMRRPSASHRAQLDAGACQINAPRESLRRMGRRKQLTQREDRGVVA